MSSEKMNNVALKVEPQVDSRPDVRSIMAAIRARVASEVSKVKDRQPAFIGQRADFSRAPRKPGELIHSEELRYLNAHHAYPQQLNLDGIVSHRPGPIGRLVVAFKRKAVSIVWHSLLKDYFSAEKDFQSNLVRYLNDVSKYVDARDAANFLDLVAKIDTDNKRVLDRVDRLVDQQAADLYNLTCRVDEASNASPLPVAAM